MIKRLIKHVLKKRGFQIKKIPDLDLKRRILLMTNLNIETVFDIGASTGQYASNLRELGYTNRIISFEPLKDAFKKLYNNSINDNHWSTYNYALGNEDCTHAINVSGNSHSSSILEMLPSHIESAPTSKYIGKEEIEIKRLDSVFNSFCNDHEKIMLKIDTQGFEIKVLEGASGVLGKIDLIQLEMSLIPLYETEMLFDGLKTYLDEKGFQLVSLENGFSDKSTGQLLQVDGIFVNKLRLDQYKRIVQDK